MRIRRMLGLVALAPAVVALAALGGAAPAGALAGGSVAVNTTNQSNNWSGYNVSALQGSTYTPVTSVAAQWVVPTASAHQGGQSEHSAMWIGIGGGCIDSGCNLTDSTLIQAGTEQDVNANGSTSYSAWWEAVPAPSVTATSVTVNPGDHMQVSIIQSAVPEVWTISIKDTTNGESATGSVDPTPYASDYSTAEYILETPVTAGTSGAGIAVMPNLSGANFDLATLNGNPAGLNTSDEIQLVDTNNNIEATPSAPDPDTDGFNVCTWASTCAAPASS